MVEASTGGRGRAPRWRRSRPGFAFYVCDERGRLRQHVNIFVEEERVVDRRALSDPVEPESRVFILQALSGG